MSAPKKFQTSRVTVFIWAMMWMAVSGLLASCQSDHKTGNTTDAETIEHDSHQAHETTALTLNNGAKWKADASTNANVAALTHIINAVTPTTMEECRNAGNGIQEALNKMISECRMQGEDHEALHHWLEPLLEMNKNLLASETVEEANKILVNERNQVNLYTQYFE